MGVGSTPAAEMGALFMPMTLEGMEVQLVSRVFSFTLTTYPGLASGVARSAQLA